MSEPFDQEHDDSWALAVPFVGCKSQGGPFDDDAFTAGVEMGRFSCKLALANVLDLIPFSDTIRRANLRQADLFVMHVGLVLHEEQIDTEVYDEATITEWAVVTVDIARGTIEGPPT